MRDQFLGLRKKPIDQLIKKMESEFLHEKSKLMHDLDSISSEKAHLLTELKELNEKKLVIQNEHDFWELGNNRLESVIQHLNVQKNAELLANQKNFDEHMRPTTEQLHDLDFKIKASERLLDQLFAKVGNLVEQSQSDLLNPPLEEDEFEDSSRTESVENGFDQILEGTNQTFTKENVPVKSDPDGFWGNMGNWMVEALEPNHNSRSIESDSGLLETKSKEIVQTEEQVEVASEPKKSDEPANANRDNILIEQIDSIKTNYIVGKLAGDDLLDQNGQLIVSKYSLITKEVVDKANRAGKLADLIVHMKLSGPGVG